MKRKLFISVAILALLSPFFVAAVKRPAPNTTTPATFGSLVALGDSVAAGVGLKDDSDSSACDRTNQSYPNQVAQQLNYSLKNLACSGASLTAGILGKQDVNKLLIAPQRDQLFALPKPNIITVTIGANDVSWTGYIGKCYVAECGTSEDIAQLVVAQAGLASNLHKLLSDIQAHYPTQPPKVFVTGYYQVFPEARGNCSDLTGIDASEQAWVRNAQTSLEGIIKTSVASYPFVTFVAVDFSGHELCSPNSWVQSTQDTQPYHPTVDGQTAYAKQLVARIKAAK